jgi:putative ABC transport system permease protein
MIFINVLWTALRGIGNNKLRSILTTLGIIIGVASVIAMLALGNGARAAVEENFRFLGSDIIQISPKTNIDQGEIVPVGRILSYEDGLLLAQDVPLVKRVEMSVGGKGKVRFGRTVLDMDFFGVTADAMKRIPFENHLQPVNWPVDQQLTPDDFLADGRFFTPADVLSGAEICILGHETALDLFHGDDPLDEVIWVNRGRCLVIGVLRELETINPAERNRSRPNEALYMPISTAIHNLYDEEPSIRISARVNDESQMREAKEQVETYLRQRHNIVRDDDGNFQDDFDLLTRLDVLGAKLAAAYTFSLLLAAMAAVSLIVGGIGIMNVMLVSVTERTREIGVRMAIGARPIDIVVQFLLEAILISTIGGLLGVVTGVLAIPLAATLNQGVALLSPSSIPLALGMAILVGIVFGLYPAYRASRLDPIEALRYE